MFSRTKEQKGEAISSTEVDANKLQNALLKMRDNINNLINEYCDSIDSRDWSRFENIFTEKAVLEYDYSLFGVNIGKKDVVINIIPWISKVKSYHSFCNHMVSNIKFCLSDEEKSDLKELMKVKRVKVNSKLVCHQTVKYIGISYVSVATLKFNIIKEDEKWKIEKVYEKKGVLAPSVTFENIVFGLVLLIGFRIFK